MAQVRRGYSEGATVGYKWFFERGEQPLFPFGFGLSYTSFGLSDLSVKIEGSAVTASAIVRNSGGRAGAAIPEFYLTARRARRSRFALSGGKGLLSTPAKKAESPSRSTPAC